MTNVRLPISETFTSLQGEGKLTGVPSHFIRLSGCNLRCAWCDTPYASWQPEGDQHGVDALVRLAKASGVRHAVVTGGEPMIFKHLDELCVQLRTAGLHITIETAGTVHRAVGCDLMSISPKLSNSTPRNDPRDPGGQWERLHEERRINLVALQALITTYPQRQLKFVVAAPQDLHEIETLLSNLTGWNATDIMLMPEGVRPPDRPTTDWMVRECIARGWRYCPRLHIHLFGNTRGT